MPSSRTGLLTGAAALLLAAVAGGVMIGWWVFRNVDARLRLTEQPATVVLPKPFAVQARILNDLKIAIDGKIKTRVPVDQSIQVPIRNTLHVVVGFDHTVPIKMTVPIHAQIPVDQRVHVDSKVQVEVLGQTLTLPVRGDIPIKTTVPLNLDVPVDQPVRLKFSAPTDVRLAQALTVPLKTRIATTIPIHSTLDVPVKSALQAEVTVTQPVDAIIQRADLKLPLHTLRLRRVDEDATTGDSDR